MKKLFALLTLLTTLTTYVYAQAGREVHGMVVDSTKQGLPGTTIKLTSDQSDNVTSIADANGRFSFANVKGSKLTLTISSIGFEGIIKHYTLESDGKPADVGTVILKAEARQLGAVTVTATNPVTLKEDTVEYRASAYKVRANSPVEDQLRKIPGVDVDAQGNVSAQGKQVTRVRINGKDFFGGDVQTATKNLPADLVDSYQIVDDYGDQANLTGIKTGEPNKILNITIRRDKNNGYFGQLTAGEGSDALPKDPGVENDNRYVGLLNYFNFNNDRQISVLGNLNNTNVNTFSFGNATPGGGGGGGNRGGGGGGGFGGGGFGGGGGGRGNAARGSSGQTSNQNGINTVRTIGTNFRDQWGKNLSVYGSYSFADNTVFTRSLNFQRNNNTVATLSSQSSIQTDESTNHRFTWNMEYRPDTLNYFKLTPTFSYGSTTTGSQDTTFENRQNTAGPLAYNVRSVTTATTPNYGATLLYNHRFNGHGRNLSINANANSSRNFNLDNPIYAYEPTSVRRLAVPIDQVVNSYYRSNNVGISLSYIEPLSSVSFLELNYAYNRTFNKNDNRTDTLVAGSAISNGIRNVYPLGTSNYDYTFTTNRVGLNYRYIKPKYNATLGVGLLPSVLDGSGSSYDLLTQAPAFPAIRKTTLNFVPTAAFRYNFSRSQSLNFNYNGSNNQPSYNQLAPVINFSNALFPVQGNPDLNPEFTNSFNFRYNKFSFESGNIFFTNLSFTQTNDKIVTNTVVYPAAFSAAVLQQNANLRYLQNTNFTTYLNSDGYYQGNANILFAKPWAERKFTLIFNGNFTYTNNIGFSSSVDANNVMSATLKNVAKTISFTPGARFRVNVQDVVDTEVSGSYGINRTNNSLDNPTFGNNNTNIRTLTLGVNGKNYFWKDWTLSYDFSRLVNYGYDFDVPNPNILNLYVERRFLKQNAATIRLQAFDVFNQNTGFSFVANNNTTTQSQVNRLGRYLMLTFTYRLQKFAGRSPMQGGDDRGGRRFGGGQGGGFGGPGGGPGIN
jgi:uncharacterized membrane protein YgcG